MTTSDHLQWSNRISAVNAYWEPLSFELPSLKSGNAWRRWIDTALDSPDDIVPLQQAAAVLDRSYRSADRSVVKLFANS